jgi:hypothetical protein
MSRKKTKDKKSHPLPKPNRQIPISLVRKSMQLGLNPLLQNARTYPLYGCWIMRGWQEAGITPVVVAREQESGRVMIGVYMVDLYCLGIKDAYTRTDYSINQFNRDLPSMCAHAPEQCTVELAHEVIYGALEYAEKIGFGPHPDFTRMQADLLLDPPDAHPRVDHVAFGKDGKPLFVSGPYDDALKIRSVINTLTRTCGEGNFDYLVGLGDFEG